MSPYELRRWDSQLFASFSSISNSWATEPYFTAWHLNNWVWRSLRGRGMWADVCNCLFTIPLRGVRLPDILVPYLHCSEACRVVPVNREVGRSCAWGPSEAHISETPSKRASLVLLRSWGQPRLTRVIRQRWEKCERAWSRGAAEGSAGRNRFSPARLSLGPTVDKTPPVTECWEWCKKAVYNASRSRTWGKICVNRIIAVSLSTDYRLQ